MVDLFDIPWLDALPYEVRAWMLRIVVALFVFFVVLLLRRVLARILVVPFRALKRRTSTDLDDTLYGLAEPAAGFIVVAIALLASTAVLELGEFDIQFINSLARSLIIIGFAVALFEAIDLIQPQSRLVSLAGITIENELMPFIRTALKIILVAVAIVIVIQEWGYEVSGLVAGLGLGGLAFSLAAQDTVSNLFGFSTIVTDRPFVVGEYIITPDVEGVVERVGVRSTKIRTLDQSLIFIPNSKMANSVITNWSRLSRRRFNFTIGIAYDATSAQMRDLLERIKEVLRQREAVDQETIVVRFSEFNSSSLDVLVRCNVMIADWNEWTLEREQVYYAIMDIIEELGLSMAFPSRSLYIEQLPGSGGQGMARSLPPRRRAAIDDAVRGEAPMGQQDEAGDSPSSGV